VPVPGPYAPSARVPQHSRMRRFSLVMLLVCMLVLAGCQRPRRGDGAPAAGPVERTVTVDGVTRAYRVHVPAGLAGPAPLVVVLHGGGGNGVQAEQQTGFTATADREGFVVVYPDGSGRARLLTWNAGTCCAYARDQRVDDVGFIRAMLDAVAVEFPVDPARVYVTGFSNGAMMAYRLGCELTDRIAAIAPISGALNAQACTPSRPLSVLHIHGTADQHVPIAGGLPRRDVPGTSPWQNTSLAYAIGFWARHDACPAAEAETSQGSVTTTTYGPCADGTEVVQVIIDGGGHAWPGGTKGRDAADDPPPAPDANAVIWAFLTRHHR
jgi:polyhydroxybutyrate depolymerase